MQGLPFLRICMVQFIDLLLKCVFNYYGTLCNWSEYLCTCNVFELYTSGSGCTSDSGAYNRTIKLLCGITNEQHSYFFKVIKYTLLVETCSILYTYIAIQ